METNLKYLQKILFHQMKFIVLKTGKDLGVISDMLFPIVGMVVVLTTFIGVMMAKKGIKTVEVYE